MVAGVDRGALDAREAFPAPVHDAAELDAGADGRAVVEGRRLYPVQQSRVIGETRQLEPVGSYPGDLDRITGARFGTVRSPAG